MVDGIFFGLAIVLLAWSLVIRRRAAPLSDEHRLATVQMYLWSGIALSKWSVLTGVVGAAGVAATLGAGALLGAALVTMWRLRRAQRSRVSGPEPTAGQDRF